MTIVYKATPGWDADARTIGSFSNDGAFTFKAGTPIGAVCGLNNANLNANYIELEHAFFIESRNYQIIEKGVIKSKKYPTISSATYKIERLSGVVRYFVDDVLIYTSSLSSSGTVFGDCSLYAYLDTITDACILDYAVNIPGTESEIPAALTLQVQELRDLLQTGPSILDQIDVYLQQIVTLVDSVKSLLTGTPVTLTGVAAIWEDVLDTIELLVSGGYGDFYLVEQLYGLITQVDNIIKNGLDLSDVNTILDIIQQILDLINSGDDSIVNEAESILEGIANYTDALEAQNGSSTYFEFLNSLVSQLEYLFSLGQANSPAALAIINAILDLISLGDEALLGDLSIGAAPIGPVGAIGADEPVNVGYIGIGPVLAAGTEADINRGSIAIGPVGALGAEGDPNWGAIAVGPLSASGQEEALLPDYNAGSAYLGPMISYGYEGIIDTCSGTAAIGPLASVGSEGDVAFGDAEIGPLLAGGYSAVRQYLIAEWPPWLLDNQQLLFNAIVELTVPAPILTAEGNDYDNIRSGVTVPAPVLTAFTGAVAPLSVPAPVLTSTGTVQAIARAELEVPAPELTATASTQVGATVELEVPSPGMTAATGAYASLEVLAPVLTATGSVGHLAWVDLTLPFIELTATAKVGTLATVELEIPAPTLEASGIIGAVAQVALVLPAIILTATGRVSPGVGIAAEPLVTETTYAVNLTTGAVTTLLLGELTKLVTAHGRLYGLRSGELVRLDGDLDGAATIPAIVRFAPQTFGSNRAKRLSTVYLNSREDDGLTLDVVADETAAWRYQTVTDTARAYGTHKVKVGRGVKFHTAGLVLQNRNGGRMDIGGMELLVDTGAPRPKT